MTLSEYSLLKQQVVLAVGGSENHGRLVAMLKRVYQDIINSPRRYEQINTIGELLEILEIRDVLSANNVDVLKHIVKRIENHHDILKKIQDYAAVRPVRPENIQHYAPRSTRESTYTETHTSFMTSNPISTGMSPRKAERIHTTLVEEIGSYWRDLGRNLGIAEGKIDNINASNESLKSKACSLLQLYEKMADPQRWFFHLCAALEQTRRRDLSRKLQDIMTMAL